MSGYEHWQAAYRRILAEVQAEMPDADEHDQFVEYSRRCNEWKRERGIR